MNTKEEILLRAQECFYNQQLHEAYFILRRFFDKLPFSPQKEHAQYIGIFLRTLSELGKENEVDFYISELEKKFDRIKSPDISYQLGMVHFYKNPKSQIAKKLFEEIVNSEPEDAESSIKSKMMLMNFYNATGNKEQCRKIINSIKSPRHTSVWELWEIWKCLVFLMEGKHQEAQKNIEAVVSTFGPKTNWYVLYSAKITEAKISLSSGELHKAKEIVESLKKRFEKHQFKCINVQLKELEASVTQKIGIGEIFLNEQDSEFTLVHNKRKLNLSHSNAVEKLLLLLFHEGSVDKEQIINEVYGRPYNRQSDDQLIYSQIHAARKRLSKLGFGTQSILSENSKYRFIHNIKIRKEHT